MLSKESSAQRQTHSFAGDPHLAEDALADSCLELLRTRPRLDSYRSARALFTLVARNKARKLIRARHRRRRREARYAAARGTHVLSAEQARDRRQTARALQAAVTALPPQERNVVRMCL
jgi:RNA polymerase sigma factor (sigma-70 family)